MRVETVDVVVFGGGMVGAAAALGFANKGYSVAIVEPNMPEAINCDSPPDMRVSAISYSSENLLRSLGAWQFLQRERLQPYRRLSVWEKPDCATHFDADTIPVAHLGYIMENRHLQLALHLALQQHVNKDTHLYWFNEGELLCGQTGLCRLGGENVQANLVVAADGGFSTIRQQMKMGETGWKYNQSVFSVCIETEKPSLEHTFQQFSETGPMAYLPLYGHYAALVWYAPDVVTKRLQEMNTLQLKAEIESQFPKLHSNFDVLQQACFPIRRNHANRYFRDKVVLCGDSAHTINPLAGQGVNIGFKDVEALLEIQPGAHLEAQLATYEKRRRPENLLMMTAMDGFNLAFSSPNPILQLGRNIGLKLANHTGPIKRAVLQRAIGL